MARICLETKSSGKKRNNTCITRTSQIGGKVMMNGDGGGDDAELALPGFWRIPVEKDRNPGGRYICV